MKFDFLNPDYDSVFAERALRLARIEKHPEEVPNLIKYYKTNWTAFINDWGMTFDPRKLEIGENPELPFILFSRQEDFVNWVFTTWQASRRGLAEKSRDVGFSWLAVYCAVCLYLFYPMADVGFGSRKKESVDNGDQDRKSLFWKIRYAIRKLPPFLRPKGYGIGNKWGVVYNPENESSIVGEIGDNIGMGARTSIYFVDESDSLEHQQAAEIALAETTNCRIDISTANNVGSIFYNKRRSLPENQIFIFDWTEDPRKRLHPELSKEEEEYWKKKKIELTSTAFASQIERNPNAALANTFIPDTLITDAQERLPTTIEQNSSTPWSIGIDASGMGNDETVVWARRGRINLPPFILGNIDGVQMAARVEKICKDLLKVAPLQMIGIERDGPGQSCADQLSYGPYAKVLVPVHTGAKVRDGENYNIRAWLHAQAKGYLEEEMPVLPKDNTFKAQGTALFWQSKNGLLLIESKDEYRKRLSGASSLAMKMAGRSPDRWDAFILTFIPARAKPIKQTQQQDLILQANSGWRPLDRAMGY